MKIFSHVWGGQKNENFLDKVQAKMMFGRATQSFLPAISNTKSERARNATQKRATHRLQVKQSYDKGARDLKQLSPGQPVYYQHTEGKKYDWRRGKVRAKHSERSCILCCSKMYTQQDRETKTVSCKEM